MNVNFKWSGTTAVLLLLSLAVGVRAQSAASAYRLTVTIPGTYGGSCHGEFAGSQEFYAVVTRLDSEIWDQIEDMERQALQITDKISWWHAERHVERLRRREVNSKRDPLSDSERESLERLRSIAWHERTRDEKRELEQLESRVPLSSAESWNLDRMKELRTRRRDLHRQVRLRTSPKKPRSLRVFPNDELQVVLMEDDVFADDTCLGTTVVLDQSVLAMGSMEIKQHGKTLLTLKLTPLSR